MDVTLFDHLDDGYGAFSKLLPRLYLIKLRQRNEDPMILRNNAWHMSTILNTFNTYYCYDISNDKRRRLIRPVFVSLAKNEPYRRLLSIELTVGSGDPLEQDDIVFHFDDDDPAKIFIRVRFTEFYLNVDKKFKKGKPPYYKRGNERTCYIVRLTNTQEEEGITYGILPYKCDIAFDKTTEHYETFSGIHVMLNVDSECINPSRRIKSDDEESFFDCNSPLNGKIGDLTETDKEALDEYIFGSDIGFLNANFDYTGRYVHRYRLQSYSYVTSPSKELKILANEEYRHMFLPSDKEKETLDTIMIYKDEYVDELIRHTKVANEFIIAYDAIIKYALHRVRLLLKNQGRDTQGLLSFGVNPVMDEDEDEWRVKAAKIVSEGKPEGEVAKINRNRIDLEKILDQKLHDLKKIEQEIEDFIDIIANL